jgi:putative peptide zinc metalloprotease protein
MTHFDHDRRVEVYPFSRQADGDAIIIGRRDTSTFLALPAEAVEILDTLAKGQSVGEASAQYRARHGETPDMEDFLGLLESKGLVARSGAANWHDTAVAPAAPRFNFTGFPQPLAQLLFGPAGMTLATLTVGAGLVVACMAPSVVPRWDALYFDHNRTLMGITVILLSYVTLFIHEMGHLVAARAAGVDSRIGISHRLWIVVAETDLTGLWAIPRRRRYLPLMAGSVVDAVSASLVLVVLYASARGWIVLPHISWLLLRALFFVYLIQILWQFFFFVRTDLYYVLANLFSCRSLMQDTENFLKNVVAPWVPWFQVTDQGGIPASERRVVVLYSVFWLAGRLVAIGGLVLISLPLFWRYLLGVSATLQAGYAAHPYSFLDSLAMSTFSVVPFSVGMILWFRSLTKKWRFA